MILVASVDYVTEFDFIFAWNSKVGKCILQRIEYNFFIFLFFFYACGFLHSLDLCHTNSSLRG